MASNLYRKNLRQWEQWSRIVLGIGVAGGALFASSSVAQIAVDFVGVFLIITGVFGWCPACATVGRHLENK